MFERELLTGPDVSDRVREIDGPVRFFAEELRTKLQEGASAKRVADALRDLEHTYRTAIDMGLLPRKDPTHHFVQAEIRKAGGGTAAPLPRWRQTTAAVA